MSHSCTTFHRCPGMAGYEAKHWTESTYIGFFMTFNSSSVFQYLFQLYLGLLFPINRILRICGPYSTELARRNWGDSSPSHRHDIRSPTSSSLTIIDGARDVLERVRINEFKTPALCSAIGLSSLSGRNPFRRGMWPCLGGDES